MPNREEFLHTGLVPLINVNINEDDECAICSCDYTDPVKLSSCGHVFDKHCIEQWLSMDGKNICPMCKAKLFDLHQAEDDREPGYERRALINQALRTSRMSEPGAVDFINRYGVSAPNESRLQRATAHALYYLTQGLSADGSIRIQGSDMTGIPLVSGPARFEAELLSAPFIAMANLIPALSAAQGRQYNAQQARDWQLCLTHLWPILKARDGKKIDALVLAATLRRKLREELLSCYSDIDFMDFFFECGDPSVVNHFSIDLDVMMNYLTLRCWIVQRDHEAVAAKKKSLEATKKKLAEAAKKEAEAAKKEAKSKKPSAPEGPKPKKEECNIM